MSQACGRSASRFLTGLWACAAAGLAMAAAGPGRDWPAYRGDGARSAYTADALPETLHVRWVRRLARPAPAWPASQPKIRFDGSYEPVVAGKRLFVGSMTADRVTAYDTETGAELWRFYTGGPVRFAPLVWRDIVFVASDDGFLYALDAATGARRWALRGGPDGRLALGNERLISAWPVRGAPVIHEEPDGGATLYFAASIWPFMGTFIHAVDPATGAVRWTNSGSGSTYVTQQHSSPAFAGVAPQGYLAVGKDLLMVSGGRTVPAAYDRRTGEFLYFDVASRAYGKDAGGHDVGVTDAHFINHGCLYNLTNGAPVLNLNDRKAVPALSVARCGDGFAAVTETGLAVYGLAPEQTEEVTTDRAGKEKRTVRFGLPLRHQVETGGEPRRAHFRAGDRVYVSGESGWVGAVDLPPLAEPGLSWKGRVAGDVWTMLPGDGKLFVVTEDGALYCFGAARPAGEPVVHGAAPVEPAGGWSVPGPDGYALVWGLGADAFERLSALAERYHVIAADPRETRVDELRRRLDEAGLYGRRVHVLAGRPGRMAFPAYLASRLEIGDAEMAGLADGDAFARQAWHVLRPYGGVAELRGAPADVATLAKAAAALATAPMTPAASGRAPAGERVETAPDGTWVRLTRAGALPRSAPWTHQNGDVANTVVSRDMLVKPPLGLLWFGGPSNDDILPRHGHGPVPQVVGGRLFIEGPHALRAVDVYTGRLLWQRELMDLGKFYDNTAHQPGANEIGGNYVSLADGVYVVHDRKCLRLDPATGETMSEFTLPREPGEDDPHWGYVGVYEDVLIAGAPPLAIAAGKGDEPPVVTRNAPYASSSTRLVAMDRHSGKVLWARRAGQSFRHNGIAAGAGKVFCIDGLSQANLDALKRRGEEPGVPAVLLALEARTGKEVWRADEQVFGTWLGYSEALDLLLESGSPARDRAKDEASGQMAAYRGSDGALQWREAFRYAGKPMLHGDTIYTEGAAFELATGLPKRRVNPLTDRPMDWGYARNYGCNTPIGGQHMLLFRSAAAGFYDLNADGGTANWGGFKSGCTANLIPADGVLSAPDYTRTCTCSYQNQCSLALAPMDDVEIWTFQVYDTLDDRLMRAGVNLGAPGDWPAPDGTLWLEYPMVGGRSPDLGVTVEGEVTWFRRHALDMTGESRQVTASGLEGEARLRIPLNGQGERGHTVRLFFAEPEAGAAGERVFDVYVQGEKAVDGLDVWAEAGAARLGVIREIPDVTAGEAVTVELRARPGSKRPPVLAGVEIIRREALHAEFDLLAGLNRPTEWGAAGHVKAVLRIRNRTDGPLTVGANVRLADTALAPRTLDVAPRGVAEMAMEVPVAALNAGQFAAVVLDAGPAFGPFRLMEERFPLEIALPLEVEVTSPSLREARIQLRSLLARTNQMFRLTARLAGEPVLECDVSLKSGGTDDLSCPLPAGLLGKLTELEITARWPETVTPAPGRFVRELDFRAVRVLPRTAAAEPALTLGVADGLFPADRRERLAGTDDLEAAVNWWWDGTALVLTARVRDDRHFNTKPGAGIWDGDCFQIGLAPAAGPLTVLALALTEAGARLHQYAGPDMTLAAQADYTVLRDEAAKTTLYQVRLPLAACGVRAEPGTLVRLNTVFFDDDTGDGYAYWRQLAPGLAGGVKLPAIPVFVLGE